MRVVIVGAGPLGLATARILVKRGNDVVIVERSKDKIETVSGECDCGFVHGDGTRPDILREIDPQATQVLLCLTNHDQDNILAALVGRALGIPKVIPKIEEPEFTFICLELGLESAIVPDQATARILADQVTGRDTPELSSILRGELRLFTFAVRAEDVGPVAGLKLPDRTRAIYLYRGDDFVLLDPDSRLHEGDEVVLVTHSDQLPRLRERWEPFAESTS